MSMSRLEQMADRHASIVSPDGTVPPIDSSPKPYWKNCAQEIAFFYGGTRDGGWGVLRGHTFYMPRTDGKRDVYRLQKYAGLIEGPPRQIESAYAWVLEGEEPGADRVMADAKARGLVTVTDYPEEP